MPVGTRGSVKGILPSLVGQTGAEIILGNTYHLLLRPGPEVVRDLGGLHSFTGWKGPMLTDSGGFQAFSMSDINAFDEDGVTFTSIIDGSKVRLTPESSMEVQHALGADIIMAFDDCPPAEDSTEAAFQASSRGRKRAVSHAERLEIANERTVRWLARCERRHRELGGDLSLFGIVQGGTNLDLRTRSVEQICGIDLPGYAIGGVAVGETSDEIAQVVAHTAPLMPTARPRYLMGVGYERDIVAAVRSGVDMFDCVLPTRNGRNANAFTREGQMRLKNARFERDTGPIEAGCDCAACASEEGGWFSRGYIRHLFQTGEMLGPILVSLHNLRHFQRLMADVREAIESDDWREFGRRWPVARGGLPSFLAEGEIASGEAG